MKKFIEKPNLPTSKVSTVIISSKYKEIINEVEKLGIECIKVPPLDILDTPIQSHPDMVLHHIGGRDIVIYDYNHNLNQELIKKGFNLIFSKSILKKEYPYDIPLNALNVNGYLFCKSKFTDQYIKSKFGLKSIINTNQGYAKCSTCVVSDNHIITGDKSIEKALKSVGFNVLLVNMNDIVLEGYDYGFIGGCCGLVDKDKLLFTGKITSEFDKIKAFCYSANVKIITLPFDKLIDIGSIIPILQD